MFAAAGMTSVPFVWHRRMINLKGYTPFTQAVMDFWPWPQGQGFRNASYWWSYILSHDERERLDLLLMMALLSQEIECLLLKHDQGLLERFAFSEQTIGFLHHIDSRTLSEYAEAVLAHWSAEQIALPSTLTTEQSETRQATA